MKYPKTYHLPQSPGHDPEKPITPYKFFEGNDVVITEKMDGSNVGLCRDRVFSRSGDVPTHPSFDRLKAFHAQIRWHLPEDIIFFGEWCEAVHTYRYNRFNQDALGDGLLIFAVYEIPTGEFASWSEVEYLSYAMGLETVPIIAQRDYFSSFSSLRRFLPTMLEDTSVFGEKREGLVIRNVGAFHINDFNQNVAKFTHASKKGEHFGKNYERHDDSVTRI